MTAPLELRYPSEGSAISVILKLPGETCNIDCHYCYEKRKPYPDSAQLVPETVARFLDLCGGRPLRVELHGGEPLLMKPPLMAELFAVLRRYAGGIHLAMQTNGLLLDDERLRFLREEWPDLDLGVSLDGDPIVNDVHRVDYRGRGTSARVEQALRRLGDAGLSVGVIATVTQPSLGRAGEIVRYFATSRALRPSRI